MQQTGKYGEDVACDFLTNKGYKVCARNVYFKGGEIDIIAEKNNKLIFVEVKTRTSDIKGKPYESVTPHKLRHIMHAIEWYIHTHKLSHQKAQIDILSIECGAKGTAPKILHIENIDIPN